MKVLICLLLTISFYSFAENDHHNHDNGHDNIQVDSNENCDSISTSPVESKINRSSKKKRKRQVRLNGHRRITGIINPQSGFVLDLFCGCGGNSISFAKKICNIISVDIDESKLSLLQHNSRIYDANMNIQCICADAYMFLQKNINTLKHKVDVILLAPPWGDDYVTWFP